jgi:integrase
MGASAIHPIKPRVLSLLSVMFNWAMKHGWREGNPAKGIKYFPEKERERERWLSAEELARLGEALDHYPDDPSVQAIKLLALTGARKAEVLGAKWTEFDGLNGNDRPGPSPRSAPRRRGWLCGT